MWKEKDETLTRTFKFKNFSKAFSFMTEVAIEAEKLGEETPLLKSYSSTTDLELNLEQAKTPRNADAIAMKELTRQCSKHIKW